MFLEVISDCLRMLLFYDTPGFGHLPSTLVLVICHPLLLSYLAVYFLSRFLYLKVGVIWRVRIEVTGQELRCSMPTGRPQIDLRDQVFTTSWVSCLLISYAYDSSCSTPYHEIPFAVCSVNTVDWKLLCQAQLLSSLFCQFCCCSTALLFIPLRPMSTYGHIGLLAKL